VLVRGSEASAVVRVRTDLAILKGPTAPNQVDKASSKISAALDALEWFNEIETANTTLSHWGTLGVPHSLLQSLVYPKLVEKFTVGWCWLACAPAQSCWCSVCAQGVRVPCFTLLRCEVAALLWCIAGDCGGVPSLPRCHQGV
jgi:hypothetical protein